MSQKKDLLRMLGKAGYFKIKISFNAAGAGLLHLLVDQRNDWWVFDRDKARHMQIEESLVRHSKDEQIPAGEYTLHVNLAPADVYAAEALLRKILSEADINLVSIGNY